jgi:hypothetical protein
LGGRLLLTGGSLLPLSAVVSLIFVVSPALLRRSFLADG